MWGKASMNGQCDNQYDRAVGNRDARHDHLFRVILRVNRNIAPAIRPASARPGDAP
jgi:hypothetical protein